MSRTVAGARAPHPVIALKAGREKSLLRRHPWIFSGAIQRIEGEPGSGDTVEVRSAQNDLLALAAYSPKSNIALRVWDWRSRAIDAGFFRERLARALELRRSLRGCDGADALRLVHGESDGLPGVVVDRYLDTVVLQCSSAGAARWRDTIAGLLLEMTDAGRVFERSDSDALALEGLPPRIGPLCGEAAPERVTINEHGLSYIVDIAGGHKTGFYLDQRCNRARVAELAHGRDVLNCFCYTGGFTLNALAGGASSVLSIDSSQPALALAAENLALNALPGERAQWLEADVFDALRRLRDGKRAFDLIVLDPPKFAPTAQFAEKAARGYKDINLLAFKLLRPGGVLVSFSCSGGIDAGLFQKIVAGAALDAGVDAQIVEWLHAAPDHPVLLSFPEGAYLKGLLCRVPG
jgi:23S rRNA (cytosine1962-C5)-methyltransferase